MNDQLYVGVMSGTSLDGLDIALTRCGPEHCDLLDATTISLPSALRATLLKLSVAETVSPDIIGETDAEFGHFTGCQINAFLARRKVDRDTIHAVGSHGQTIRHRPPRPHSNVAGFSWQIGDPNRIAEITGITTVADFRRRDVAAGGQGAPLAPAFHRAVFGSVDTPRAVLNIGGFANLSVLPPAIGCTGFDTGPGNALMDHWYAQHHKSTFDKDGAWAAGGDVDPNLLLAMLAHPFLRQNPPKSTGREAFGPAWLHQLLVENAPQTTPQDIQATLLEFTAVSAAHAMLAHGGGSPQLYVCGGGAHNVRLMQRIAALLPEVQVQSTAVLGILPDWVEAAAFAWLACRTMAGLDGNLPDVTGARHATILGAIYPGRCNGAVS